MSSTRIRHKSSWCWKGTPFHKSYIVANFTSLAALSRQLRVWIIPGQSDRVGIYCSGFAVRRSLLYSRSKPRCQLTYTEVRRRPVPRLRYKDKSPSSNRYETSSTRRRLFEILTGLSLGLGVHPEKSPPEIICSNRSISRLCRSSATSAYIYYAPATETRSLSL